MEDHISQLIEEIRSDQDIHSYHEANTKQAIIERLFHSLGWDLFNPKEVVKEYSVSGGRVDYALIANDAKKVFVEAKKITENLENHQEQLLRYAFQEGVKLAILTNGVTWWFYLPLTEGNWEQRRFYSIELLDQQADDIAERFISFLSKDNVASGHAVSTAESVYKGRQKKSIIKETLPKAWEKIVQEPDEILVDLLIETSEKLSGYRPDESDIIHFLKRNIHTSETQTAALPKQVQSSASIPPAPQALKVRRAGPYKSNCLTVYRNNRQNMQSVFPVAYEFLLKLGSDVDAPGIYIKTSSHIHLYSYNRYLSYIKLIPYGVLEFNKKSPKKIGADTSDASDLLFNENLEELINSSNGLDERWVEYVHNSGNNTLRIKKDAPKDFFDGLYGLIKEIGDTVQDLN